LAKKKINVLKIIVNENLDGIAKRQSKVIVHEMELIL
jgi:hypothetical protein